MRIRTDLLLTTLVLVSVCFLCELSNIDLIPHDSKKHIGQGAGT